MMIDPYYGSLLVASILILAWAIWVERSPDNQFSWLDMLRDETGKPSFLRLGVPWAGATSTVVLLYVIRENHSDGLYFFLTYLAVWSGAPVVAKALDVAGHIWGKA